MAAPSLTTTLLILTVLVVLLPTETHAFGAGDIPDFAYLNDKAFRHGDIESVLETLVKYSGRAAGGGLLGFASSVYKSASGGNKFSKSDIKKVYFGNWLRDYSQAMDVAGLSKLTADSLVLVVSVLGFLAFGFATEEFQVTADRLGVYLPIEHIDNPKGYPNDAQNYNDKLRPPVDPRELEIDPSNGMKKYIATEGEDWDTSTGFVRRVFRECVRQGRKAGGQPGADLWEAYRLLGTGLHTMEDLLAHSNWCEIALRKVGYRDVFCHVGESVIVDSPGGPVPPLVTGTFGGADFIHSLMGEATDKMSQTSVTDLATKMDEASKADTTNIDALKAILSKLPIGGGSEKLEEREESDAQSKAYHFDPDNIAPPDVQRRLMELLKWRDDVYRGVVAKIEMVPGLTDLLEELTNALNAYVFTIIAPYVTPLLQQATGVLDEGSKAVIDSEDQQQVFTDPDASDPSHSFLSKDHFGLILNEPAGKIAQVLVRHSVNIIVQAWAESDDSNDEAKINTILEAFHHPYYANGNSEIQNLMATELEDWLNSLDDKDGTIALLSKESIMAGTNKRPGSADEEPSYGHGHSHGGYQPTPQAPNSGREESYSSRTETFHGDTTHGGSQGRDNQDSEPAYNTGRNTHGGGGGYGSSRDEESTYDSIRDTHGGGRGYGSSMNEESTYDSGRDIYSGGGRGHDSSRNEESTYSGGGSARNEESTYSGDGGYGSSRNEESTYSGGGGYGTPRNEESTYSGGGGYGTSRSEESTYGSGRDTYGGGGVYGSRNEESTYQQGHGYRGESNEEGGYGSRHRHDEVPEYESGRTHGGHNSGYAPSYGGDTGYVPSYGHSEERTNTYDGGHSSYAPSYDQGERGSGRSSYKPHGDGEEHSSSYRGGSDHRHRDRDEQESSGYAPNYGNSEDTFGAERLNINEDENNDSQWRSRNNYESSY